jgi:hypothetical protein
MERKVNAILLFVLAMALGGCAATGPEYPEQAAIANTAASQSARLTVFRTAESLQYSGRSATVGIDGKDAGGCEYAGFSMFDVPAGSHVLTVSMWDAPGTCQLQVEVLSGATYFFEITPRTGNLVAGLPGLLVSGFGVLGALVGGVAMIAGMAAESSGKICGGAFAIESVDENAALSKLATLRQSK